MVAGLIVLALPLASAYTITNARPTVTSRAAINMAEMANGKMKVRRAAWPQTQDTC